MGLFMLHSKASEQNLAGPHPTSIDLPEAKLLDPVNDLLVESHHARLFASGQ
jgi:hypothetical protein